VSTVHALSNEVFPLLDAVERALALGEVLRPRHLGELADVPAPDMMLEMLEPTREVASRVADGCEQLLLHLQARPGAPGLDDLSRQVAEIESATRESLEELGFTAAWDSLADMPMAPQSAELLREVGLERLGLEVFYGIREGEPVIATKPADPLSALVWLGGRLFERTERLLLGHDLLAFERMASAWWFGVHSSDRPLQQKFPRSVREREWSLVERESLLLEASPLDALLGATAVAPPAKQRRLAQAYLASFASGFRVLEREGDLTVMEDLVRRRRFRVHEHNPDVKCDPSFLALGRLLALDGDVHLRSPGMVFLPPRSIDPEVLAGALRGGRSELSPQILVETLIGVAIGERAGRKDLAPAASAKEARALLARLDDVLVECGFAEEVGPQEAGPELIRRARKSGSSNLIYRRYDLDHPMREWMAALMDQAGH
jgi:hypothetical protein